MENKEIQFCEYLCNKRLENFEYLENAFTKGVFWMNSIKITPSDIISTHFPEQIQQKSYNFLIFSLNLAKIAESDKIIEILRPTNQLLDEFVKFISKNSASLNPYIARTHQPPLQSANRTQFISILHKEKQKQVADSISVNSLGIPKENENFSPEKDMERLTIREPGSSFKINLIPISKKLHRVSYGILTLFNIPFELDLKEVIRELCQTLKNLYMKFLEIPHLDKETLAQIKRIDFLIKRHILTSICVLLNETASRISKKQLDLLFSN